MTKSNKGKSIISIILCICMILSFTPNVFAAQVNEYVDPADSWISSNNRTNELDVNATTTYETQHCSVCQKNTLVLTYRVPEYTKSGETALNRGVKYSDGTMIDGRSQGNLDNGTPGVDAYYTGYHWTKSVCQTCGTINTTTGPDMYHFNNNVYMLNSCDNNFFLDFDATTYEHYSSTYHRTTLKRGEYCKFCKGTFARASTGLESHDYIENVDAQLGNNRFYISGVCDDCGYETSEYVTAKSVIASYYGVADGEAHTLTVNDLSDSGVRTSIRYGNSADNCNLSSAPNYTQPGYYTVYYKINYTYASESMTENGVSYIHIVDNENDDIILMPAAHEHEYHYLETILPTCEELGYERFQCGGCGELEKRNYKPALGHHYEDIVIKEPNCKDTGLVLTLCEDCGDFYQTVTTTNEHKYKAFNHNPTCRNVGYTEYICEVCGDNYINNIQPIISHSYERITKEPTCVDRGYTTSTCTMCGFNTVSDYTEPTEHSWDDGRVVTNSTCDAEGVMEYKCLNDGCAEKMVRATSANGHTPGTRATCIEPQICTVCETVLALPNGHNHTRQITEPTCTAMGYSTYTCECGDSYIGDYTNKKAHNYREEVTHPTCTTHGFTTYICPDCDDTYISDYVDATSHNYIETVTAPSCTEMGFTTFECEDCDNSYVGNYVDMTEHNYNRETVEPTCTEHGYAVYTCPDCGKSYIGDYTDCINHTYNETVIAPSCTEMGYTIFKCNDCDDEYISDYTDKLAHEYETAITEATCITMGYTTYTCSCGDTYKADYKEALGHTLSEWIVDSSATIINAGHKHIECTVCAETLQSVELPKLIDKDNTDEDGKAQIGDYTIIITDEIEKPIFNAELTIDVDDNVSIKLTDGRLLDYEKPTTIKAFYTETKQPKENLKIYIEDVNGNKAIGFTDANGQLTVPNNKTNTNDDNGTIGKEDGETKETFVITVTDKANVIIPDCEIYIGESNNIVVDLPDGIKPTRENPVIVTVKDHNGNAKEGVTVIAIGENDYIEKGVTDAFGKILLPVYGEGYTDIEGIINVNGFTVTVKDSVGAVENAFVKHKEDGSIFVVLPDGRAISYTNRVYVTVTNSILEPEKDIVISVDDETDKEYTDKTDSKGTVVFPPLTEDITNIDGSSGIEETKPDADDETEDETVAYIVVVSDTKGVIENAFVKIEEGKVSVTLPETHTLTTANQTTVTVSDNDGNAVKDVSVTVKDKTNSKSGNTDANGKVTLPVIQASTPSSRPSYSSGGGGSYSAYPSVKITDKDGKSVTVTRSNGTNISTLTLPTGKNLLKDDNYYNILVTSSSNPKKGYVIVLKDRNGNEVRGTTDDEGKLILPSTEHKAYIVGFTDGTFRPDSDMTRGEAAAIFARLIAEEKNETISGASSFKDVNPKDWCNSYIAYLEKYDVITGYSDKSFRADETVTRAEFVTMAVRYYMLFNEVKDTDYKVNYTDLKETYWAYKDIAFAKNIGWLNGYADGSFKGDNNITRAEVVTVINHATGRIPDKEYINENVSTLNKFTDLKNNSHWGYYDIVLASNNMRCINCPNLK